MCAAASCRMVSLLPMAWHGMAWDRLLDRSASGAGFVIFLLVAVVCARVGWLTCLVGLDCVVLGGFHGLCTSALVSAPCGRLSFCCVDLVRLHARVAAAV